MSKPRFLVGETVIAIHLRSPDLVSIQIGGTYLVLETALNNESETYVVKVVDTEGETHEAPENCFLRPQEIVS